MKYLRLLRLLLKAKWDWAPPANRQILIFDRSGADTIIPLLPNKNFQVLDMRGERINLPVIIANLLARKSGASAYAREFIARTSPRLVITYIDNNPLFYSLKANFPGVQFAFIQNGMRGGGADVFAYLEAAGVAKTGSVDMMFVYGAAVGKEYKKYVHGTCFPVGSVKANSHSKLRARPTRKPKVAFISQYHVLREIPFADRIVSAEDFFIKPDKAVLTQLAQIVKSYAGELEIIPRHRSDEAEEKYFKEILGNEITFARKTEKESTLETLGKYSLIATIDSSLGYEAIALGHRVAFFSVRGSTLRDPSLNFGWPAKLLRSGPFWTNDAKPRIMKKILDFCLTATPKEWEFRTRRYLRDVIAYDAGNSVIRSQLQRVCA